MNRRGLFGMAANAASDAGHRVALQIDVNDAGTMEQGWSYIRV